MSKKNITFIINIKKPYLWIYVISFLTIYHVLYFHKTNDFLILRLYMQAEKFGVFKVALIENDKNSSKPYSRKVMFPAGAKGHKIVFPSDLKKISIRFEFDDKPNRLLMSRITIEKNHKIETLNFNKISKNIVANGGIDWELNRRGIMLSLAKGSKNLEFHDVQTPMIWPTLLIVSVLSALIFELTRSFFIKKFDCVCFALKISAVIFVISYWWSIANHPLKFYQTIITPSAGAFAFALLAIIPPMKTTFSAKLKMITSMAFIFVFTIMLFIPSINMYSPEIVQKIITNLNDVLKENQNKHFQHKLKEIQHTFENNYLKYFYKRKEMINQNALIKIKIFGISPSPKAIYGKNGMFYEGYGDRRVEEDITRIFDNVTDYVGLAPFSRKELERWRRQIDERYIWLKNRGVDYVFAIAPTKAQIYPENLPDRIIKVKSILNRPNRYDQLIDYLNRRCLAPVVDLRKALRKAKDQPPFLPLYYRTDFHWNYYGAFIAYQAIVDKINQCYPKYDLRTAKLNEFDIKRIDNWVHARFLNMLGLDPLKNRDETYLTFYPKKYSRYNKVKGFLKKGISDYTLPMKKEIDIEGKRAHIHEYHCESGKVMRMIIMGDSFIEKVAGYFSVHNKHTINFRTVDRFPIAMIKKYKPDIVVQEMLNMYLLKPPAENPEEIRRIGL